MPHPDKYATETLKEVVADFEILIPEAPNYSGTTRQYVIEQLLYRMPYDQDHSPIYYYIRDIVLQSDSLKRLRDENRGFRVYLQNFSTRDGSLEIFFQLVMTALASYTTLQGTVDYIKKELHVKLEELDLLGVRIDVKTNITKFKVKGKKNRAIKIKNYYLRFMQTCALIALSVIITYYFFDSEQRKKDETKETVKEALQEFENSKKAPLIPKDTVIKY